MDHPGSGRIVMLTDVVIGTILLVMLLVLQLPDPPAAAPLSTGTMVAITATYAVSFVAVAIIWANHRQLLRLVPRSGRRVTMLNTALLACIATIPASIFYLDGRTNTPAAVAFYAAALMLATGAFVLIRASALRALRRGGQGAGPQRRGLKTALAGSALYGVAALAAFISVDAAVVVLVVATLLFIAPLLGDAIPAGGPPGREGGRRRFMGRQGAGGRQYKEERAKSLAEFEKLIPGGKDDG